MKAAHKLRPNTIVPILIGLLLPLTARAIDNAFIPSPKESVVCKDERQIRGMLAELPWVVESINRESLVKGLARPMVTEIGLVAQFGKGVLDATGKGLWGCTVEIRVDLNDDGNRISLPFSTFYMLTSQCDRMMSVCRS